MPYIEERLKKYFKETGFDAIEVYYQDGHWVCCIMTGCQGESKPTINEAIISAIEDGK